jgi:hypothetical protein
VSDDDVIKFTAVLDEFAAAQRAAALGQAKRQRITVTRPLGDLHVQFELVVDEGSSPAEIYEVLAPLDAALDRLKAKVDLASHYERINDICGQIDLAVNKLAGERAKFQAENEVLNETRRAPVVLTTAQRSALDHHRGTIRDHFVRIEEVKIAAGECMSILKGASRLELLDRQINERLDKLRVMRPDAA